MSILGYDLPLDVAVFALIAVVFLYLHLFIVPFTPIYYEEDHLYILHDAWRMYEGEMIYRDFFQIMYPGTQLLYLGFFYAFGLRFWIVDAIILLQALVSVMLILAISRKLIADAWYAYLPPSLYLFFGLRWLGIDGNHRVFSPIFALLAVYVLLKKRTYKRIIVAGVLCGIASFFTQQRGVLAIGGIGLFLLIDGVWHRTAVGEIARKVFAAGAAYAVTITALVLPFVVAAGPEKFFGYTLFFISSYIQDPTANYGAYFVGLQDVFSQGFLMSVVALFYYSLIPLVYLVGIAYVWFTRKRDGDLTSREGILLVSMVGLAFAVGTFAPTPSRLFQVAAPALIVFGWLVSRLRPYVNIPVRVAVVGLVVVGMVLAVRLQTRWDATILDTPTGRIAFLSPVALEKFVWLKENANANDYVFEVYNCTVNFALLLRNPTEATHLLNTGYSPPWQVAGAIESLEAKKARFIIWDGNWDAEMVSQGESERLKPLYRYLNAHYEMKRQLTPYSKRTPQIWERKSQTR